MEGHHEEAEEVDVHGGHSCFQQFCVLVEDVDAKFREEGDESPGGQSVANQHDCQVADGLLYSVVFAGTEIITQNWMAAVADI